MPEGEQYMVLGWWGQLSVGADFNAIRTIQELKHLTGRSLDKVGPIPAGLRRG